MQKSILSKRHLDYLSKHFTEDKRVLILKFSDSKNSDFKLDCDFLKERFLLECKVLNAEKASEIDKVFLENEIRQNSFDYIFLDCNNLKDSGNNLEILYKKIVEITDCLCDKSVDFMVSGSCKDSILHAILKDFAKLTNTKNKSVRWLFSSNNFLQNLSYMLPNCINRLLCKYFIFTVFEKSEAGFIKSEAFTKRFLGLFRKKCTNIAMNNFENKENNIK